MDKADRSVRAAEGLLRSGDGDFATSRAYYAMLYAAEALLAERGLRFRKHGGVHAAFGEHFAKTGQLDPSLHRWLLDAFDKRIEGDYGLDAAISAEDAGNVIDQARRFAAAARGHLDN